jgi:hypothetical protein
MDVAHAQLPRDERVLAVRRQGETLSAGPGRLVRDGAQAVFVSEGGSRVVLDASDSLVVEREYGVGERIPGRGVVRAKASKGPLIAGIAVVGAAAGLAAYGGVLCGTMHDTVQTGWFGPAVVVPADPTPCYLAVVASVTAAAVGIALLVAGAVPRATVERERSSRGLSLVPVVGPGHAVGTLSVSF